MNPVAVRGGRTTAGRARPPLSCWKCKTLKIRCNRKSPCDKCTSKGIPCIPMPDKSRPITRAYVDALEGQIAWYEILLGDLGKADHAVRDIMLSDWQRKVEEEHFPAESSSTTQDPGLGTFDLPYRHTGKDNSSSVYGRSSIKVEMAFMESSKSDLGNLDNVTAEPDVTVACIQPSNLQEQDWEYDLDDDNNVVMHRSFSPRGEVCEELIARFFHRQYTDHMCLYREYFLRDYQKGGGPHYSDLLMYTICSLGAMAKETNAVALAGDMSAHDLSDHFANRAQEILYGGALEAPNLTTLQAMLLLGQREVGRGKASKGWLLTGSAFRLAHEMGLHLDPDRWKASQNSDVEREILRRVYWAAFVADKQLSLYFGRPPALRESEADVNGTVRILYPSIWEALLAKVLKVDVSENDYENGKELVDAFIQQVELSKIVHTMITEVFENRNRPRGAVLTVATKAVGSALERWLTKLPNSLYWNIHTRHALPSYTLHLHLYFHTVRISLHRPPREAPPEFLALAVEDIEICNESTRAIIQLMKIQKRQNGYNELAPTSVHTIASAASIVLLNLYMEGPINARPDTAKQLEDVLAIIDGIAITWNSALQVREMVDQAVASIKSVHDLSEFVNWDYEATLAEHEGMFWLGDEEDGLGLAPQYPFSGNDIEM